jgi:hypothetical protein
MLFALCMLLLLLSILSVYNRIRTSSNSGYRIERYSGGVVQEPIAGRGICLRNVGDSPFRFSKVGFYQTTDDALQNRNELLAKYSATVRLYTKGITPLSGSLVAFTPADSFDECSPINHITLRPKTSLVLDFMEVVSFSVVRLGKFDNMKDPLSCRLQIDINPGNPTDENAVFTTVFLTFPSGDTQNHAFIKMDGSKNTNGVFLVSRLSFFEIQAIKFAADKVIADKAAADKVVVDKAIADKVAADNAIVDKAIADRVAAEKAIADKAIANKAIADRAIADKVAADKAILDKATADKAISDKVIADKAIADKAISDKVIADKVIADKVIADKAIADKAIADKVIADKVIAEKAIADKAVADKVIADKVIADKVIADKAAADKAAYDNLIQKPVVSFKTTLGTVSTENGTANVSSWTQFGGVSTSSGITMQPAKQQSAPTSASASVTLVQKAFGAFPGVRTDGIHCLVSSGSINFGGTDGTIGVQYTMYILGRPAANATDAMYLGGYGTSETGVVNGSTAHFGRWANGQMICNTNWTNDLWTPGGPHNFPNASGFEIWCLCKSPLFSGTETYRNKSAVNPIASQRNAALPSGGFKKTSHWRLGSGSSYSSTGSSIIGAFLVFDTYHDSTQRALVQTSLEAEFGFSAT